MKTRARIVGIALLAVALVSVPAPGVPAPDRPEPVPPKASGLQEAEVIAVLLDQRSQQPTVVLQGKRDRRQLVMAIEPALAMAIAVPLQGRTLPRPLTHDLFLTLFGRLKVMLTRVVINDFRGDIYYATLYLNAGGPEMELDSRPSDAIALAIRAKVPVLVADRVFDKSAPPSRGPSI